MLNQEDSIHLTTSASFLVKQEVDFSCWGKRGVPHFGWALKSATLLVHGFVLKLKFMRWFIVVTISRHFLSL